MNIDDAREVGDPEADDAIAGFAAAHPDLDPRLVVAQVGVQLRAHPEVRHQLIGEYLLSGPPLPEWVDARRVHEGQEFFRNYGLFIGAALFCASLPDAYAAADGVEVLAITAELVSHPRRRIAETGRFLLDVMALDGDERTLEPGGRGYQAVRGVRLMHAAVRALVRSREGDSWVRAHGVPVNQRDLVGTLCTFTSVVYAALDRLGVEYSEAGAEAHLHTWCAIGHLLGIREELLPWSRTEADELAALLRTKLHRPSPAGALLTRALLDELEEAMPRGCRTVPHTVMRHLIGDATADLLGVPPAGRWRAVLDGVEEMGDVAGAKDLTAVTARSLGKIVGRTMWNEYIQRGLDGKHAPFEIPDDIAAHWELTAPTSA